eukprot:scaffold12300_cov34-Phaeocystis_antarctica.AAC.1
MLSLCALPGERRAAARASAASVQESARQNAAHHAASEPPVPGGRACWPAPFRPLLGRRPFASGGVGGW